MQLRLLLAVTAVGLVVPLAHGDAVGSAASKRALETEARDVAVELFRTVNERRYERSCELLADGKTDRNLCVVGLRVGFMWSQEIRFRVTGVRLEGDRAFVEAIADGAPGQVVLTRLGGRYRVLRVESR
jgi:hypothetical protein